MNKVLVVTLSVRSTRGEAKAKAQIACKSAGLRDAALGSGGFRACHGCLLPQSTLTLIAHSVGWPRDQRKIKQTQVEIVRSFTGPLNPKPQSSWLSWH